MEETVGVIERERLEALLKGTSRTFALNLPLLPGMLRDALTLGYLLLRNADTIEDAYRWTKERRQVELDALYALMENPDQEAAREFSARFERESAIDSAADLELLRQTPFLLSQMRTLPEAYAAEVRAHIARVIRRMKVWVAEHDESNHLRLERISQLDDYCYSVAGIVGELVTSLIALYRPTLEKTRLLLLRTLETGVGAGLQLTNIIKDVFRDHLEGRYYIPREYLPLDGREPREQMKPMFAYAYRHLCLGIEYACTLPEPEIDIRRAVLLPLMLAVATLARLLERVEELFAGVDVKISRDSVADILALVDQIAGENQAIRRAWRQLSGPLADLPSACLAGCT